MRCLPHRLLAAALLAPVLLESREAVHAQCQSTEFFASDASIADQFGLSLSTDGRRVLVGAPSATGSFFGNSGAAYIFEKGPNGFVQAQKLFAANGGLNEEFGWGLDLDGDRAAIGAFRIGAPLGTGGLFIFDRGPGGWTETELLIPAHPAPEHGFAVALDGDRVASSRRAGDDFWVFELAGGQWSEVAHFTDTQAFALDMEGDTIVTGEPESIKSGEFSGAVQVYERIAGVWTRVQLLVPQTPMIGQAFGFSIDLEGDRLMVGAPGDESFSPQQGTVHEFRRIGGLWTPAGVHRPFDEYPTLAFGRAVDLKDGRMAVGSGGPGPSIDSQGCTYVYEDHGGGFQPLARFDAVDSADSQGFGSSVALFGDHVLVGSPRDSDAAQLGGSVYDFELSDNILNICHCTHQAPCGNEDPWGGCVNGSGSGALLNALGSTSVSQDDLRMQATSLPANRPALLFMGAGFVGPMTFGNGQLCIGHSTLWRFPVQSTGARGCLQEGPGLVSTAGQLFGPFGTPTAGTVMNFQVWFRDPTGPCGAGSNLSNGIQVHFTQ